MGFIWVVCPKILTDNSTEDNMQRNASIWWCIYVFSMVIGKTEFQQIGPKMGNFTIVNVLNKCIVFLNFC